VRLLSILLIAVLWLNAQNVEIVADNFFADEKKQVTVFNGNVKIVKGKDKLFANKLTINFDKDRQPLKYIAVGDVKINMILNNKHYYGEAQTMIYDPVKAQYTFLKNAFLFEKESDKKVYGDRIWVDQSSGRYEVDSDGKKPVKFIFKIEDNKKEKTK